MVNERGKYQRGGVHVVQCFVFNVVFVDHCIIWSSLFDGFWLSLWYFPLSLTIVSSGLLCFMASEVGKYQRDNQKP
jgi:hypothetical protein